MKLKKIVIQFIVNNTIYQITVSKLEYYTNKIYIN